MLRPHLDRLHAARPDAFKLTLIGVAPDIEPAPWLSKISPPAGSIAYPRFVRWLRDQGPFDVGLAPLVDTAFNRGKSDIKMLDYAALGALPILEETPAYRADPHAADIIVQTTDWYAALIDVLDNRDAARQRAAAAETYLWRSRCVSQVAPAMLARLEALADR